MNIKRIGLIGGSSVVGGGANSGSGDNLWALELGTGVTVNRPDEHIDIVLGTDIRIGTDGPVDIGSNVYIESGFDSRKGKDSLWKETGIGGSIESVSENRYIILGPRVNIGANSSIVTIDGAIYGFEVSNSPTNRIILIGTNVEIGGSGETIKISSAAISITDFQESSPRIYIGEHFNTNDYFNIPTKEILPAVIPFESLSNGNIKLGEHEFMPATPSGDPMHYAYETAGAEYNATTDFIVKDAPWKDMVDTIEDKAKWGFDVVDASQVKQMTIGGTTYNYVQTTRRSPEGTTEPRYFLVGQASDGTWVEDEIKVLRLPGHWYLNGLGDITNKEMRRILDEKEVKYRWDKSRGGQGIKARTTIPVNNIPNIDMIPDFSTPYSINAESLCVTFIHLFKVTEKAQALSICHTGANNKTRYIQTCKDKSGTPFSEAHVVSFINLTQNCNISNVPLLSKPSIIYTINNATPTTSITITLHADRYAQLSEDADIIAALEAKNTALEGTGASISLVSA